jgi:nitroreductase
MEKPATNNYPIAQVLKRRWSPRAFSERPVETEKLQSLFEAARWAASSFNEQPWSFLLARKENVDEFALMLACLMEKNQQWARLAPVLMISVAKLNFDRTGKPNRHAYHDVGLAVGNMIVQATTLDLFVHQMAGILPDKIRETYGIPEGFDPVAGIAIGYAGEIDALPEQFRAQELGDRTRKPIAGFVFEERWGQPSSIVSSGKI